MGERSMRELIEEMNDAFIKEIYRDIRHTIEGLTTQKETNDVMLKQKLSFTNSMLEALKPKNNKRAGTYNSYGKMKR